MSAFFDVPSLIVVLLLFTCSTTYLRSLYPNIFNSKAPHDRGGLLGFCWKASRVGERLSPYVGALCLVMAIHVLFVR